MKIFYSAYTCKGNIGDLLINKYQIEEYSKYGDVYVDLSGMPDSFRDVIIDNKNTHVHDFVKTYRLTYRGKNMFRVLWLLRREGFTHFTKSPGPYAVLTLPLKVFLKRLLGAFGYWFARKLGMKVFALGVDVNFENCSFLLKKLNVRYFKVYNLLGVRSKFNENVLLKKNINSAVYCPDMAFLCSDFKKFNNNIRKKIALSFRKVENVSNLLLILKSTCSYFKELGYDIEVLYQVEEDKNFCKELSESLAEYSVVYIDNMLTFEKLKEYEKYDYVFSNRLHVLLMGVMHGAIPFAIVSRDRKEKKIIDMWNNVFDSHYYMYLDESPDKIKSFLAEDLNKLKENVYNKALVQNTLCKVQIEKVFENYVV